MCCHQNKPSFTCCGMWTYVAMSGDNSSQTPKKKYTSSVISCCRLCGSVKDVLHCKNLFKKATEELLALAEAVFGGTLQRHELRPHLVCRPCERRLNKQHSRQWLRRARVTSKEAKGRKEWKGALRCHRRSRELWRAQRMERLAAVWISLAVPKIKALYLQLTER